MLTRPFKFTATATLGTVVQVAGDAFSARETLGTAELAIILPFDIGIYTVRTKFACPNLLGAVYLGEDCSSDLGQVTGFSAGLLIRQGQPNGIDYRIDGTAPARSVTFRWYVSGYSPSEFFNFSTTFYEDRPTTVLHRYFSMTGGGKDGRVFQFQKDPEFIYNDLSVASGPLVPNTFIRFDPSGQPTFGRL